MATSKEVLVRIGAIGRLVHGSLVEMKRTCGKEGCKCARGERHSAYYLSRRVGGRTRLEHVSRAHVETVRRWRKNYERLCVLVEELTTALVRELRETKK
jgi:hypothetical protein